MPYDRRVSGSRWKRHRWVQKWLSKRFCVRINYWFDRMGPPHKREVNPLKWQYLPFCRLSTVYWIRKLNPNHIAVEKRNMLLLLYKRRRQARVKSTTRISQHSKLESEWNQGMGDERYPSVFTLLSTRLPRNKTFVRCWAGWGIARTRNTDFIWRQDWRCIDASTEWQEC